MTTWAETQGKMLSSDIASSEGFDSSTNSYQTYYEPIVTYQYEVGGASYTGTRVTEMPFRYGAAADVQKFIAAHPAGSTVTVYYDPTNPASAVLEKGLGGMATKQALLAGGVFTGIIAAFGGMTVVIIGLVLIVICIVTVLVLALLGSAGFLLSQ